MMVARGPKMDLGVSQMAHNCLERSHIHVLRGHERVGMASRAPQDGLKRAQDGIRGFKNTPQMNPQQENIDKKHGSRPWLPLFSRFLCVFVFRVCSRIVHFMFHDCRSRAGRSLKAMQDSTTNGLSCAQNAAPGRPKIATRSSNVRPT